MNDRIIKSEELILESQIHGQMVSFESVSMLIFTERRIKQG
jgi:hypothetical protein